MFNILIKVVIKMDIEVLISTVQNSNEIKLLEKMNILTDAIIINQSNNISSHQFKKNNHLIKIYSFDERGVGLSRNNALMRSTQDICLMADDDMVYLDNYKETVINAYEKFPDADMIVFNVRIHKNKTIRNSVRKTHRVRWFNCLKYGTVTFSFKRLSVFKSNTFFSLEFGGGAKYGSGEDSLFIIEMLKKGNKVYAVNETIADVHNDNSSWFTGYNEKFFYDKGALFERIFGKFYRLLIIQFIIRKNIILKEAAYTKLEVYKLMVRGAKNDRRKKN